LNEVRWHPEAILDAESGVDCVTGTIGSRLMASHTPTTKEQARALLEKLPDDATWDDIVYELAARRSIELGLADAEQGRVTDASTVRRELRLRT
jgi:hypothetical protein